MPFNRKLVLHQWLLGLLGVERFDRLAEHLREFEKAGIEAEFFNKDGRELFAGQAVVILEVTKLKEEMGEKTVAVDAFNPEDDGNAEWMASYLTACLLAFFQQQRLHREQEQRFQKFNLERPLWVFVGGTAGAPA